MSKINRERDIFILAGAMLRVMCILKESNYVLASAVFIFKP